MYSHRDFVPDEVLAYWSAQGNTIGGLTEWLLLFVDLGNAVLEDIRTTAQDHVPAISYISPNGWETMISSANIKGVPLNIGLRSRLRQVLLSARIVTGVVRPMVKRAPSTPVVIL